MPFVRLRYALVFSLLPSISMPSWSDSTSSEANSNASDVEVVYVFGEPDKSDTATKLNLTVAETPQTVTTISAVQIKDFGLTNVNSVLDYAPGVTVEEVETDRTYYTARGFDIVNFQYDGVSSPFVSGINLGQQDSSLFEKVEVIKGAAGLITGVSNPSATINYVRKRPTEYGQASAALTLGDWNGRRLEGDLSGSLSDTVRGRIVAVSDKSDSYLDRHSDETKLGYGILEFDATEDTLITLGYSKDQSDSQGVLWGALPLVYSDGSRTDYDVSTSNSPEWTYAKSTKTQTFFEVDQNINADWSAHLLWAKNAYEYDSELFYVYGTPDAETEVGLFGYASAYDRKEFQTNLEVYLSGQLYIGNQEHQLVAGYSRSKILVNDKSYYNWAEGFPVLGSDWDEGNTPPMDFDVHNPDTDASDLEITHKSYYLSSRWNLLDSVSLLAGARTNKIDQTGSSYGASAKTDADKTTPYIGATWEFVETLTLYASYSEVFKQQTHVDNNFAPLGAVEGESTEFGIKKSFNEGLANLSIGAFKANQSNFGEFAGRIDGIAVYEPAELDSEGYEVEFSGEVLRGLNLSAGYTDFEIEDKDGNETRTFIPQKTLDISGSYQLPIEADLKVGAVLKWQDDISTTVDYTDTEGNPASTEVVEKAYTLIDLAAHYQATENLGFSLNVENATDKKHLKSLYWTQAYYGEPRNVSASIRVDF